MLNEKADRSKKYVLGRPYYSYIKIIFKFLFSYNIDHIFDAKQRSETFATRHGRQIRGMPKFKRFMRGSPRRPAAEL